MANNTLAEIRARLTAAEQNNRQFDNSSFPFWNAKTGSTSVLRFLPDGDSTNKFFWVEKLQIKLPFNGILNGDPKPITVNVPCVEMWGREEYPEGCPILAEVRAWYNDPTLKTQANKYWKKPSYLMQGFVRDNAVLEDKEKAPENPIRRFSLNKQLFNLVKAGLMDKDMENTPCDYENGSDFRVIKTRNGEYDDYGTSSYSRKESVLTSDELEAIEKYGLNNLGSFLGKKPTSVELKVIHEMFEASVEGLAYDQAKWGNFYRPMSLSTTSVESSSSTQNTNTISSVKNEENVDVTVSAPKDKPSTQDILTMIRNKGKKTESKA